jgi:plasmid stabilization system protein ParE
VKWYVRVLPLAEADLRDACDWYGRQRPGLGDEFLQAVEEALRALEAHPERHPIYYRGIRRILTRRFPFKLFYLIEADRVEVLRVLHAHRDHRRWLPQQTD